MTPIPSDETRLDEAVALGLDGMRRGDGGPFGALVTRGGAVVARGWNRVLVSHDPTAHAEIVAVRAAAAALGRDHLEDCTLYSSCEPCPMCLAALYWARLGRVVFAAGRADAAAAGFADEFLYRELNAPLADRAIPFAQIPRPAALEAFRLFRENPDKKLYGPAVPC